MIIRLIKLVIDTVIQGYALYTVSVCIYLEPCGAPLQTYYFTWLENLLRKKPRRIETAAKVINEESTAPSEIITEEPLPPRPPRMADVDYNPCYTDSKTVNNPFHSQYRNLRNRLTSLEQNPTTSSDFVLK